jgi:hypothetical protein
MKSLSNSMLEIAGSILTDASQAYPSISGSFVKDIARLTRLVEHRGLGVFTLDLPALDNLLLAGLENGRLPSSGFTAVSKKVKVPRLYSGLYLRVFNPDGVLLDDADPTAVAFLRQLNCLGKKLAVPCSKKRELDAIKEYVDVERSIREPSLEWDSDTLSLDRRRLLLSLLDCVDADLSIQPGLDRDANERTSHQLLRTCQRVADIVSREIGAYHPDAVIDRNEWEGSQLGIKHGPGAVAERGGRLFNKYRFTNWSAKLDRLYPYRTFGRMPNDPVRHVRDHEVPARLICVPKTAKGPRIIAAEPSEHMFCQMLLKDFLEKRIKETFIGDFVDFKRQDLSASMVSAASLDKSLATIDLSSASDRLSCWLLERVLRKNQSLIEAIHASRTRQINISQLGLCLNLKKFASQGTAITFPVQTIVFLVIAFTASLDLEKVKGMSDQALRRELMSLRDQVRVYGDDIIVPTHGYVRITQLMHDLGLKVNTEKSFFRGHFRESCGQDSFKGYDVTPVKPKSVIPDNPDSRVAVLDTTNNLFYKGYWNASDKLRTRLDRDRSNRFPVVGRGSGITGYGSFSYNNQSYRECIEILSSTPIEDMPMDEFVRRTILHPKLTRYTGVKHRLRFNYDSQNVEARVWDVVSHSKVQPYDCGYSALLDSAVKPSVRLNSRGLVRRQTRRSESDSRGGFVNDRGTRGLPVYMAEVSSVRGVAERPSRREAWRWVVLTDLFGQGQRS